MQTVMGIGEIKKPVGPPPRPPPNEGVSTMKLKPPPMAPPPRDLASTSTAQRPAVENIKTIDPSKTLQFGNLTTNPSPSSQSKEPPPSPGPGTLPGRGFAPTFQPTEFDADSKKPGIIEAGRKGAAPPKFVLKATKKEGAISMFEPEPEEKKPPPAESKVISPPPKSKPPPPVIEAPSGIPEGKPLPPDVLPPSRKNPPRPTVPPPSILNKGRAPPTEEIEDNDNNNNKKQKVTPPTNEPPFKRGYKKPVTNEEPIIHRRDKEFPEFEESSSDEENEKTKDKDKDKIKDKPSPPPIQQPSSTNMAMEVVEKAPEKPQPPPNIVTEMKSTTPSTPPPPTIIQQQQLQKQPSIIISKESEKVSTPPQLQKQTSNLPQSSPSLGIGTIGTEGQVSQAIITPSKDLSKTSEIEQNIQQKSITTTGSNANVINQTKPESRPSSVAESNASGVSRPQSSAQSDAIKELEERSDISGSVISQLIAPPPGVMVLKNPYAAQAQTQGIGDFIPPTQINQVGIDSILAKEIQGGRLNITCIQGIGLRKKDDKSKTPRVDPYIKFKLGAAEKWPWKITSVKRKQESDAIFDNELIYFDVINPAQYIYEEDLHLMIEVWNKGTFKDEIIGTVTMSVVRFFKTPYLTYTEKIPIIAPGDKTSTSKICLEFLFQQARPGLYVFTLYEANRLRNIDPMGQQNPYIQFSLGGYKKKSRVIEKGGRDPYFGEEDVVMWVDSEIWTNDLKVELLDKEIGEDNPIAYTDFSLLPYMDILPMAAKQDTFDLFYKPDKRKNDEIGQGQLSMKVTYLPAGTLEVTVVKGKHLLPVGKDAPREGDAALRIDPFVSFTLNSIAAKMTKKTPVDKDGGSDPTWQKTLKFDIVDQYLMDIECYHHNIQGEDELIGTVQISLLTVFKSGVQNIWVTLKQNKPTGGVRECGDINLILTFVGPPSIAYPQYRPGMESFDDALRKAPPSDKTTIKLEENDTELVANILKEGNALMKQQEFTDEEIENAFKFIDLDHNNFIGAAEIRHILICMGELITDEEIDMMISMVDLDGDGQVSFTEFRKLVLHPNPALMDKDNEITEDKLKEIEQEKLIMAGKINELDAATYQRQKELQARDNKKRMILNFLNDNEYDFDNLKLSYTNYLSLPKEQRIKNMITFDQFCTLLKIDPINENNRLFNLFDEEKYGKINFNEFLLSCFNFVNVTREVRLPYIFGMYDENRTGYITLNEIREILKGNHMMNFDYVERKAQTIMKQSVTTINSATGTQSLTLKEFLVVSKKFPNIILPNLNVEKKDD